MINQRTLDARHTFRWPLRYSARPGVQAPRVLSQRGLSSRGRSERGSRFGIASRSSAGGPAAMIGLPHGAGLLPGPRTWQDYLIDLTQQSWERGLSLGALMVAGDAVDGGGAAGSGNPSEGAKTEPPFPIVDLDISELVAEHSDAVFRVAMSVTRDSALAEDVSQDAIIKAWQALPTYRGEAPLRNWILRITHNTAVSALRKRREELRDPAELPERTSHVSVESTVQDHIAFERFTVALDELDETSRAIVTLRELEGCSYDEICDILDLPLPTVKTRLLRARRQLARSLDGWRP